MKECPNCGYDLDKRLTKSEKQKRKEQARVEQFRRKNPDECYCRYPYDSRNYDTDKIVETGIYIDVYHPLMSKPENEGPYNKRVCGGCGGFYIDNPPILCG
jgi:hypothetical protein